MIAVVQRVSRCQVRRRGGPPLASIDRGLAVLLGVERGDGPAEAASMARRLAGLRIFEDAAGKMNLDLRTVGGGMVVVSQFTLAADTSSGNRPSFIDAARPEEASPLIELVVTHLRAAGLEVGTGAFGADMEVELVNDGPVTIPIRIRPASAPPS